MIKLTPILKNILKEEEDFNVSIGPWDNFSPEYQEFEDQFGVKAAGQLRTQFKDKVDSPKNLSSELLGKDETWFDIFIDGIENGDDVEDAWSMADMILQDQEDIERGLDLAHDILNRPDWEFDEGNDNYADTEQLFDQMNEETDNYFSDLDTDVVERLFDRLSDLVEDWLK